MASTVEKRIQSVLSLWAMSIFRCLVVRDLVEDLATVLVALELVEAGAGGRQQHGVAGHGVRVGISDGGFDGLGRDQRHGALKLVGDLGSGGSNQQGGVRLGGQRLSQSGVFQTLILSAEDYPEPAGQGVPG